MADTKDAETVNKITAAHLVCAAAVIISILAAIYKIVDAVFLGGFDALMQMLFETEARVGEGDVFFLALIFVVSVILVWLFIACLAALAWFSYFDKISTGGAAIILALLCLVLGNLLQQGCSVVHEVEHHRTPLLGNLLQQGCSVVLNFVLEASDPNPFSYFCIVCFAVYCAVCVLKGVVGLLDEIEVSQREAQTRE